MVRAEMCVDDPKVSEAHAMVSIRGLQLKLLALRGRIWQRGVATSGIVLETGTTFSLGHGLNFVVKQVTLPRTVLGIEGLGLARQALGGVMSIYVRPAPQLIPGFAEDADAVLWGEDPTATVSTVIDELVNSHSPDKITNPGMATPNRLLFLPPGDGTAPSAPTGVTAISAPPRSNSCTPSSSSSFLIATDSVG